MTIIDLSNHKLYTSTLRPMADVRCAVLHTTGYGPGLERLDKQALAGKIEDVGEAFAVRQVKILKYRPHYLVGRDGKIFQLMPHNTRAPHTGSGNLGAMRQWPIVNAKGVKVNKAAWEGLFTTHHREYGCPADLPVWPSPNAASIGVDLLESPSHTYPDAQLDGLVELLVLLHAAFPKIVPSTTFTHSMIDPIDRTNTAGRAYDLSSAFDLQGVLNEVARRLSPEGAAE